MRHRVVKRFHPPGTAPGTIAPPVASAAGPVSVSVVTYTAERATTQAVERVADVPALVVGRDSAWLRIVGHDTGVLSELAEVFGVHPLVLEDVANVGQRPKVEEFDRYLFVVVDVLRCNGGGELEEEQISLLLFENLLISIQEHASDLFRPVEERLNSPGSKVRQQRVDYLAYALVDAAVDQHFPTLERIGEQIDEVEEVLLDRPDRESFEALHRIKRRLIRLRKATWPLRETISGLTRTDSGLVREGTRVWLRDVYDHTVQIIDVVETFRELTSELADLYLSSVSNRLNEVMKVLTVISTTFLPLTFIVGVYGMNFSNMPELSWRLGYAMIWGVILAVAAGMVWMFRRRGWL